MLKYWLKNIKCEVIDMNIITVMQDMSVLKRSYRSKNHRYKSNNWLKMHGETKRRKPFKKEVNHALVLDEFGNI